jgi:hypothetical protein
MSEIRHYVQVTTDEAGDNINATNHEAIRFIHAANLSAAVTYVTVYNLPIASVTVGTTVPIFSMSIAADSVAHVMFPDSGWDPGGPGLSVAAATAHDGNTAADAIVTVGLGA